MKTLLFVCTGNYYRSRFAEVYFRHLAALHRLAWQVDSRGLELHATNQGPLSRHTIAECQRLSVSTQPQRWPVELQESDLVQADLVIAVKEKEHRPLMRKRFPDWEAQIEYWQVHDLDLALPTEALSLLRQHVDALVRQLLSEA